MKLSSISFLAFGILLLGCVERKIESPLPDPVLLKPIAPLPTKGGFLKKIITDHRDILKALEEFRETDLATGNLNDLSKLRGIRKNYVNSLVGSGAVFALVPNIERNYRIQVNDIADTVSVTLPKKPYLNYLCSDMVLNENHNDICQPNSADFKTSLDFHGDLATDDFKLEIPAGIIGENSEALQSVYFVSFELPSKAMDSVSPYSSTKNESEGNDIYATDWQYSYNEKGYSIIHFGAKKSISSRTIIGNFHGVALIDRMSGEVLVSKLLSAP